MVTVLLFSKRVATFRHISILLLVALSAGYLLLYTRPVAASSRFEPFDDNWIYSALPNNTYKNGTFLDGRTVLDGGGRAFGKFQITEYVSSATLYFYVYSAPSSASLSIKEVPDYDANTLTWNNQPAAGATVGGPVTINSTGWKSVDITDFINDHYGQTAILGFYLSSGQFYIYESPRTDHYYIEYTPAPLTKPAPPAHCWNFDDNQDIFGNLDLTVANGATVGATAGVVDYGLGLPSALFSDASFLSPYPAASDFSVSFWASGSTSTEIQVGSTASNGWKISYIPNNYVQIYSDADSTTLGAVGDSDFISVIWAGGVVTLTINTTTYTDTLAVPTPSNDNYQIYGDNGAVVDQLMIFTSSLSSEEIAWLYRGGVGRSCGEWVPTALVTMPPVATPQYQIALPSGGTADVFMSATAGELIIGFIGLLLSFLTIFALMLRWSNFMAKR